GPYTLADFQDYRLRKNPDTYTPKSYISYTLLHRRKKSRKAVNFEKNTTLHGIQLSTTLKDLQHYHLQSLPLSPIDDSSLNCTLQQIKHIIKKLPFKKIPGPDKITTTALKKLSIKPVVQMHHIFKVCLKLSYFPWYGKLP
ncbi:unnamed protein product, partial [Heterotrigona itama]